MANNIVKLEKRDPESAANYWKQYAINTLLDLQICAKTMKELKGLVQRGRYFKVSSTIDRCLQEIDRPTTLAPDLANESGEYECFFCSDPNCRNECIEDAPSR